MSDFTEETTTIVPTNEIETMNLPTYRPAIDIIDLENEVLILADMPGVTAANLEVTVEKNELSIQGSSSSFDSDGKLAYSEYRQGQYRRTFTVADTIERDQISATMRDGVLQLTLPKAAVTQPRRITVDTA